MKKNNKIQRVLMLLFVLNLLASTAQAQQAGSPKNSFSSYCQFYGGASFPHVGPSDKGWEKVCVRLCGSVAN